MASLIGDNHRLLNQGFVFRCGGTQVSVQLLHQCYTMYTSQALACDVWDAQMWCAGYPVACCCNNTHAHVKG